MRKALLTLVVSAIFVATAAAQTSTQTTTTPTQQVGAVVIEKKRGPIFRANKEQVSLVQKMLKLPETGKLSDNDREAIKTYQAANGLKQTGTLNRATLEKMNVELTDKQKAIPVNPNSYASAEDTSVKEKKPRKPVFRASKDQIVLAQRMLKEKGFYMGDETGKLDPATRDGIKKFQESVNMKETGTLNRETLEKMNIELTEKQKAL